MQVVSKDMTRPLAALHSCIGKNVAIICKDNTEYTGKISEVDEIMNIVLYDALKNGSKSSENEEFLLLHGNMISIIQLDEGKIGCV